MLWSKLCLQTEQAWYDDRPHPWLACLIPVAWLYACIVTLRRYGYHYKIFTTHPSTVPVIVVGNLVLGGVGKTPCVIALIEYLHDLGYRPGVISRGYGGRDTKQVHDVKPDSSPEQVGDEPVLIASRTLCPVVVCRNRVESLRYLLAHHNCDLVVSDDGLQHYALQRMIEIVVFDRQRQWGNRRCFPAGPLREPLTRITDPSKPQHSSNAHNRPIDFLIENNAPSQDPKLQPTQSYYTMQTMPGAVYAITDPTKQLTPAMCSGKKIYAVTGIANPKRFFATLEKIGYNITGFCIYPDHHHFVASDIDLLGLVIMTEKDAVKYRDFADKRHFCLSITAHLSQSLRDDFKQRLAMICMQSSH